MMDLVPDQPQHERRENFLGRFADRGVARTFLDAVGYPAMLQRSRFRFAADRLEPCGNVIRINVPGVNVFGVNVLGVNVVRRRIDDVVRRIGATQIGPILSACTARVTVGKWYRSVSSNKSTSTFDFFTTPVAAGFRGCVK